MDPPQDPLPIPYTEEEIAAFWQNDQTLAEVPYDPANPGGLQNGNGEYPEFVYPEEDLPRRTPIRHPLAVPYNPEDLPSPVSNLYPPPPPRPNRVLIPRNQAPPAGQQPTAGHEVPAAEAEPILHPAYNGDRQYAEAGVQVGLPAVENVREPVPPGVLNLADDFEQVETHLELQTSTGDRVPNIPRRFLEAVPYHRHLVPYPFVAPGELDARVPCFDRDCWEFWAYQHDPAFCRAEQIVPYHGHFTLTVSDHTAVYEPCQDPHCTRLSRYLSRLDGGSRA